MERHIETIYCDDIRHEINGKVSYIGVYSSKLLVNSFPITLPKLCLDVKLVSPADNLVKELTLSVLKDEEVLQEIVVDKEKCKQANQSFNINSEDDSRVFVLGIQIVFSPLELEQPCKLRIRAKTEEDELKGLSLRVEEAPKPENLEAS